MAQGGTGNSYPREQCTWWASERYHQLTGLFVPWAGNAGDWAKLAPLSGWSVSSSPVVPSIICLASGVQGASKGYGHVGVVEKITKAGIETSNLNWQPNPGQVTTVMHTTGSDVTFLFASGARGKPLAEVGQGFGATMSLLLDKSPVQIAPDADVTAFLTDLDRTLDVRPPFDNLPGDPIGWLSQVAQNLFEDTIALTLRVFFLLLGLFILYKVAAHFIDFGAASSNFSNVMQGIRES